MIFEFTFKILSKIKLHKYKSIANCSKLLCWPTCSKNLTFKQHVDVNICNPTMSDTSSTNKNRRQNRYGKNKPNVGERAREVLRQIDKDHPTMQAFMQYNTELVEKQDRYERIVKLSRDITIESKRIIFLLHNCSLDM